MRMVSVAYKYVSVYRSLLNMNRNEERVYVCMRVCVYAFMRVCVYACMCVCVYACMRVCVYAVTTAQAAP